MAKVLAWGTIIDGLLISTSILNRNIVDDDIFLNEELIKARNLSPYPIIELVDKSELDKANARIAELETNQTLQP